MSQYLPNPPPPAPSFDPASHAMSTSDLLTWSRRSYLEWADEESCADDDESVADTSFVEEEDEMRGLISGKAQSARSFPISSTKSFEIAYPIIEEDEPLQTNTLQPSPPPSPTSSSTLVPPSPYPYSSSIPSLPIPLISISHTPHPPLPKTIVSNTLNIILATSGTLIPLIEGCERIEAERVAVEALEREEQRKLEGERVAFEGFLREEERKDWEGEVRDVLERRGREMRGREGKRQRVKTGMKMGVQVLRSVVKRGGR